MVGGGGGEGVGDWCSASWIPSGDDLRRWRYWLLLCLLDDMEMVLFWTLILIDFLRFGLKMHCCWFL